MPAYLLDTNIVSETRKLRPNRGVIDFLETTNHNALYLSVLTVGELHKGGEAKRHADSAAADLIAEWLHGIESDFADRILPIDPAVARRWAVLSAGQSRPVIDTLIAAAALVNGLTLATRNERDFLSTGVRILNPWID